MTIDWWTLGLQAINAIVLVWLLGRFFWRPVSAMITARRDEVARTLAEADSARAATAAARAEIARTRDGFAAERSAVLAAAEAEAAQARAALLAQATQDAAALRAAGESAAREAAAAATAEWEARSGRLAVDIAGRLVARLDSAALSAAFLDGLVAALAALPDSTRHLASDGGLELVSAAPLDATARATCGDRLAAALGTQPALAFRDDAALLAGLELHGPHFAIRNSWRADLDRILADLGHAGT
jgi:F-type H+-transporting ATPase subunit b